MTSVSEWIRHAMPGLLIGTTVFVLCAYGRASFRNHFPGRGIHHDHRKYSRAFRALGARCSCRGAGCCPRNHPGVWSPASGVLRELQAGMQALTAVDSADGRGVASEVDAGSGAPVAPTGAMWNVRGIRSVDSQQPVEPVRASGA